MIKGKRSLPRPVTPTLAAQLGRVASEGSLRTFGYPRPDSGSRANGMSCRREKRPPGRLPRWCPMVLARLEGPLLRRDGCGRR